MRLYIITNKVNGAQYVGRTVRSLVTRWSQHKYDASRGSKMILHRALRKYGVENFTIQELPFCPQDEASLNEWEVFLIDALRQSGRLYNATDGGEGISGFHLSKEQRRKLRDLAIGRVVSADTRRRQSDVRKGRKFSIEHRLKMSAALKMISHAPMAEETKRKIGMANRGKSRNKGRPWSEARRAAQTHVVFGSRTRTHCRHGHELTAENNNARGECVACTRAQKRKWYHKKVGV